MKDQVVLVDCPRDAIQGLHNFIATDKKVKHINTLIESGLFDVIDFGSFVSPKAVPQLADTKEAVSYTHLIGLFPFQVLALLLEYMPERRAMDLCIQGRSFSAEEAMEKELLYAILEPEEVELDALKMCIRDRLLSGELEVELIPQGTLATRCMAAGYGMPAIYTPAGVGTEIAEGKEVRNFKGKDYLLEYAFDADFAIVKAWKGDKAGNLIFRSTARNFNPIMAMAGKITIAEVEELVEVGELNPDEIHTPGIYVHRIFQGEHYEKRIEQRTVRPKN